ncbi:MAG TPA: ribosome-associated translation inhibitor RaiA [Patescibacteria group bacterium]|nr:ribosome-associated translation inhibitor RaiA [Patescibacteria group bacterium]
MIRKIEISGVHMDVGDDLQKYAIKKLGSLDKYIPRLARASAHLEVKLKETKSKDKNERTCEILLHLPKDNLAITETTVSIYAAIDIAEQKLKLQLHKYKELHSEPKLRQRIVSSFKHSA